jgi:hypothetical protein
MAEQSVVNRMAVGLRLPVPVLLYFLVVQWLKISPFEGADSGSTPLQKTVLIPHLVRGPDCDSGRQGSMPVNTQ